MRDYGDTINRILNHIDAGGYIYVKCADDTEKFLCKKGVEYKVSTDKQFRHSTLGYTEERPVAELLKGIRGYGAYVPDEDCQRQIMESCGCDS